MIFSHKKLNRKNKLEKLNRVLTYQISGFSLLILSFFVEFVIVVFAACALIFSSYLIYILWGERKIGWIASFIIMMFSPLLLHFVDTGIEMLDNSFYLVPIVSFFLYCFLLKIALADWIQDKRWKKIREIEIAERKEIEEAENSGKVTIAEEGSEQPEKFVFEE
ncbi:MAG: hypothetical protein GXX85_07160 [Ignavibacteria bacterium]|nr:hypothetical protein [Ignavibacteria bacterium]